MIKLPFVDRVKFFVERQFVKGAGFQLLVVAAVIGAISLIGGLALLATGADLRPADAVWWAFLRLTDPGYLGDDEGSWRRVISTLLTVSGYVVFLGALVAILTQWLIARMREFERGLTPVSLSQHLVIAGWTNRTLPLLRELLGDDGREQRFRDVFGARRTRAVVMSESVSPLQSQALRADPRIGRRSASTVVLRYGSLLEEDAIRRAGCLNAAAVIMPIDYGGGSELVNSDVEVVRALLSIDAGAARHGQAPPLVVAEIQDARRTEMVRSAYSGPVEVVPSDDVFNRIVVQSYLHPGLPAFVREVLSAEEGNEFMLRPAETLAGARLGEVAARCPRAVLLGLLRREPDGLRARLGAPSDTRLQRDDLLVFLARRRADLEPVTGSAAMLAPISRAEPAEHRHRATGPTRILMLGWSRRVPNLIAELASYPAMRFEVDLISIVDPEVRRRAIERYSPECAAVAVNHIEGDYLLSGQLEQRDLGQYSAIFLLSSDQLESAEEADARVVVGQRVIRNLVQGIEPAPRVLLELADADNVGLVGSSSVETLVSPILLSHLMARVALRPEIRLVFEELFTEGGAEIDFRPPRADEAGVERRFAELEARAGRRGEILMGVRRAAGRGGEPELVLNPPRETVFELTADDRLCVLARISGR